MPRTALPLPSSSVARRWLLVVCALAVVVLAGGAEAHTAGLSFWGSELPELCPAAAAGGSCPGCGLTRAGVSLLQGEPGQAWRFHPAVFGLAALPLVLLFAGRLGTSRASSLRRLLVVWMVLAVVARAFGWI